MPQKAIRALLMEGAVTRWSAHSEALLFAAARADHVEKRINPAIGAGIWVICDRFVDSSRAYQGLAGGIDDAAILALHAFGSRGLLPDRTFVLEVPHGEGAVRATNRDGAAADRFAARGEGSTAMLPKRSGIMPSLNRIGSGWSTPLARLKQSPSACWRVWQI